MADSGSEGLAQRVGHGRIQREALGPYKRKTAIRGGVFGGMGDPARIGKGEIGRVAVRTGAVGEGDVLPQGHCVPVPINGFWRDADWLFCRDGKFRPVEPGTFPLAHGASSRVGRLRAYGNAIVPQVAEAFIRSFCELRGAK